MLHLVLVHHIIICFQTSVSGCRLQYSGSAAVLTIPACLKPAALQDTAVLRFYHHHTALRTAAASTTIAAVKGH